MNAGKVFVCSILASVVGLSGCAISPEELNKRSVKTLNVYDDNSFALVTYSPPNRGTIYSDVVRSEDKDVVLALSAAYEFYNVKDIRQVDVGTGKNGVHVATITFQDGTTREVKESRAEANRDIRNPLRPGLYWVLCDRDKNCPTPGYGIISMNGSRSSDYSGDYHLPLITSRGSRLSGVREVLSGRTTYRHITEQELQERRARHEAAEREREVAKRKAEAKNQAIAERKQRYADELKKQLPRRISQRLHCSSLSGGDVCSSPQEILRNHLVCHLSSGPVQTNGPALIREGWKLASYTQHGRIVGGPCGHVSNMNLEFAR